MLYLELKTSILPSLKGTDKRHKMNSTIVSKMFQQLHYIHAKYDKSTSQIVCNLSDMGATVQSLQESCSDAIIFSKHFTT